MGTILDLLTGFMVVMGCIFTGILIMAMTKAGKNVKFRIDVETEQKED